MERLAGASSGQAQPRKHLAQCLSSSPAGCKGWGMCPSSGVWCSTTGCLFTPEPIITLNQK